ncbi:hypothetical protein HY571_02310 [Candidatus Micrarchaeota archaeon]|nr:hypothetical protein [Candidatus Micrarchaeota archaeon]
MKVKILALMLLFVQVSALVPSELAIEAASFYLRQGEQASIVSRPYLIDAREFYAVYFHPQTDPTGKNLVIVIDAETGELVVDEEILEKVYSFDSKLSFLQAFVRDKKLSFQDVNSAVQGGRTARDQAQNSLDQVENNLLSVDENIAPVQTAFSLFTLSVERLSDEVQSGVDMQELFETEYSAQSLEALIDRYNSTFSTLRDTVKAGENYQAAVINRSNDLTRRGVDQNLYRSGLQSAFEIGLERFSSSVSLQSAFAEFNAIDSPQTALAINDSIASYLYRKNKVESDAAVQNIRPSVEEIIRRKTEVQECTSVNLLEKLWRDAQGAQGRNEFSHVVGNVTLVQNELERIRSELDTCAGDSSQQEQPKDNLSLYIGAAFLLLVGFFAWRFYSKKKAQPSEQGEKGNLFEK